MTSYETGADESDMEMARTIDVRRADKNIDAAAAWIADVVRCQPGQLVDLSRHEDGGNRICIRIERTGHEEVDGGDVSG